MEEAGYRTALPRVNYFIIYPFTWVSVPNVAGALFPTRSGALLPATSVLTFVS